MASSRSSGSCEPEFKSTCDAAEAFLNSERAYVENGLRVGFETFLNRLEVHNKLNQSILSDSDIQSIFGNYRTIYNANSKLFDDLMLLRLRGINELRDNLGKNMVDFIPYFRMYTDYIVKKQAAIARLDKLKKSSKKFKHFLKINEMCTKRKLKSFLEEPAARLPQYLQHLADVYVAFEHESGKESSAGRLLLQAIVDIKAVTDEIAIKCRDLKARLLVGALQKDVFGNKIQLLSAHRYCISHASMNMLLKSDKIKIHKFILCNDILVVSTLASSFKSGQLIAVYPLIGLRIARNPNIDHVKIKNSSKKEKENDDSLTSKRDILSTDLLQYRFALVPQNKNFTPSDTNSIGSIIIICDNEKQLEKWIETIEESVDEEEHNLKPCNPVDLEKRLRKQKTSKEGQAETINITDPEKIKQIEAWKQAKAEGRPYNKIRSKKSNDNNDDHKTNNKPPARPPTRAPPTRQSIGGSSLISSAKPPPKPAKPPPRRPTSSSSNSHKRNTSKPPSGKKSTTSSPPPNKQPPSSSSKVPPKFNPPKKSAPKPHKKNNNKTAPPSASSTSTSSKRQSNSRKMLLSGITSFKKSSTLKHIDAETLKKEAAEKPQNVTNLLQSTLKNYRQFVMDDDDSDESDADWDD